MPGMGFQGQWENSNFSVLNSSSPVHFVIAHDKAGELVGIFAAG